MKHTRMILKELHSRPSMEQAAYDAMEEGDSDELSSLSIEALELTEQVYGQLDEAGMVEDKIDRAETLGNFIGAEIANDDRVATPNEIALIEQATDAVVDGTGENVDTVIPSLEAFEIKGGARPALEALGETITNFLKTSVALVKNAGASFGKFIKGLVSRLQALKNKVEKVEKLATDASFADSVTISGDTAVSVAFDENKFISDFGKAVTGLEGVGKTTTELSGPYAQKILTLHDGFVKQVQDTIDKASGRGDTKAAARGEIGKKIIANVDELGKVFGSVLKDGKDFGGLYVSNDKAYEHHDDITKASFSIAKAVPEVYRAGNVDSRDVEMKGFSKESVQRLCKTIKMNIGALSKTKETGTMWNVDFFTDVGLGDLILEGFSTTMFLNAINRINRAYISGYTRPLMAYINHFFRVADAQLNLAKKSMK